MTVISNDMRFTGKVATEVIHETPEAHKVRILSVTFDPGVTTYWHAHRGGQVLHITQGNGRVRTWGEPVRKVVTGDTVVAAPGEKHWHGANPGDSMTHIAVSIGAVDWMEAPDE